MSAPAPLSAPVQPGDILAGKYKIERILGIGGMGVVVAAVHVELDERVAIKFMLEDALGDAEAVERFAREARASVRIKNEHVARVSDVGKLENGAPYMVMEYLEGEDLAGLLEKRRNIPLEEAVGYVIEACEAVAEAHALGIVHRDLKPANLFLAERSDGTCIIKVLDFGISKAAAKGSRAEMSLTKTTTVMGSPYYMSPEQMRASKNADTRSDIWALGVILHELISGKTVFEAGTMTELCAKVLTDDPEPLSQAMPGASREVEAVILRCLDKSPGGRFQSVGDLATALAPFTPKSVLPSIERIHRVLAIAGIPSAAGEPGSEGSVPIGEISDRAASPHAATLASWGTQRLPVSKGGSMALLGVGVAVVALGATLFVLRRGDTAPSPGVTAVMASSDSGAAAPAPTLSAEPIVSPSPPASASAAPGTSASAEPPPSALPAAGKSGPTANPRATVKPVVKKPKDLFAEPK